VYVTCLWPLLLQEALPSVNVGTVFKVRVFMIVGYAMLATFVDTEVLTHSTLLSFDLPLDDWISLNLFSAAILLTSCVFFWGLDRMARQETGCRSSGQVTSPLRAIVSYISVVAARVLGGRTETHDGCQSVP